MVRFRNSQKTIRLYYKKKKLNSFKKRLKTIIPILLLVSYMINHFAFFSLKVKENAMYPLIDKKKKIFLSKLSYGVKKPFRFNMKKNYYFKRMPKRGDVVAIVNSEKIFNSFLQFLDLPIYMISFGFLGIVDKFYIVRRIVGLPGDRIFIRDRNIYINGKLYKPSWKIFYESNTILTLDFSKRDQTEKEIFIPENFVFVLCDNWEMVVDSRSLGLIPFYKVEGKMINMY